MAGAGITRRFVQNRTLNFRSLDSTVQQVREKLIGEPPLLDDGVEAFCNFRNPAVLHERAGFQFVPHDNGWHQRDAFAFSGKKAEHRHVVYFSQYDRPDSRQFEYAVERNANITVQARQKHRFAAQVLREAEFPAVRAWPPDQADRLLIEKVISLG